MIEVVRENHQPSRGGGRVLARPLIAQRSNAGHDCASSFSLHIPTRKTYSATASLRMTALDRNYAVAEAPMRRAAVTNSTTGSDIDRTALPVQAPEVGSLTGDLERAQSDIMTRHVPRAGVDS